jgi:hypothetical protein
MFIYDFWDLNVVSQPNTSEGGEMYNNYADRPVLETLWQSTDAAPVATNLIRSAQYLVR